MSSLRDIRRQLRSIENIKKITDAMERVAAARLRKAQAKAELSRPYVVKMKEVLENLADTQATHPLFEQRAVKKIALVVMSADRGLCGSFNTNIINAAETFLKKYQPEQVDLILVGRKAIEHFRRKKWKVRREVTKWTDKVPFHEIHEFSDFLVHGFIKHEFDEVWLIYTHYISIMRRKIIVEKFLNIGKPRLDQVKMHANFIFEPDPDEILAEALPRFCVTRIQTILYESYAAELAARILAMQTASKNSEEMITHLTLVKNKMRQRDITREMIEISSGAEGLK